MDSDLKFFGTMIMCVFIIGFIVLTYMSWETKLMTDKGYIWIPTQQGHWILPKGESPK